jgi:peroxiredoxin family protein
MADKMSLLLVSGTDDKLMAGAIIASGGVANDMDVDIFVSFWALLQFKKGAGNKMTLSYDGKDIEKEVMKKLKDKKVPSWMDTLRQAKQLGNVKVYGCSMFSDLMDLKKEDFDPIIDEVIAVSSFVNMVKDSKVTLFI